METDDAYIFDDFLVTLCLLLPTGHAKEHKKLGLRDGAIIFATGYGLQLGAIATISLQENLAPLAVIAFMGAGFGLSLVGDEHGHNGSMRCTVVGTLVGTDCIGANYFSCRRGNK